MNNMFNKASVARIVFNPNNEKIVIVLKDLFWEIAQVPIFVCVGALLHIIEDGICGKVPLIWRKRKIGIKLFRVGSSWEYFISYTICVAALYYKFML